MRAAAGAARVSHPRLRYYALVAFLLLCLLGGGAARPDVLSLVYLRPAAILCLAVMALSGGGWEFRRFRAPLLFVALLAVIMIAQLVPLPPQLWLGLPGHSPYAEAAAAAGFPQPWRPLSLTPDLTLNSLLALLPFLVVLVGFAGIREEQRRSLLLVLISIACADGVLGAVQFVSGPGSPAYLYAITNDDSAVGFFSNRNHNAIFMAAAFPMIAAFLRMGSGLPRERVRLRLYAGGAASLFLILMIVVTGSRAGMVIGLLSFILSALYAVNLWRRLEGRSMLWTLSAVLAPVAVIVVAISTQRALSLDRLIGRGATDQEGRLQALPTIFRMIRQFWPLGSGFGSFDKAFRGFEPASDLGRRYLNHAHNDLAELVLTGGLPALLLLLACLAWLLWKMIATFRLGRRTEGSRTLAFLGAAIAAMLLLASLVDYPLRTPLLSALLAAACCWLAGAGARRGNGSDTGETRAEPADKRSSRKLNPLRIALVAGVSAGLVWVTAGVTGALVIGPTAPDFVLRWWGLDAATRAGAAFEALQHGTSRHNIAMSQALAAQALQREPVNVEAVRTLAIADSLKGESQRAERLMRYAESLSRRDLPTQLWLIESSVRRNDIQGALQHYDRALRTSGTAGDLLFPVLLRAADNEAIRAPLAALLSQRPIWWRDFAQKLVMESRSVATVRSLVAAMHLRPSDPNEREFLQAALQNLVQNHDYRGAYWLYLRSAGQGAPLVRNGGFESDNNLPPFDWILANELDLSAVMQAGDAQGHGRALQIAAQAGMGGEAARQLLLLPAGRYRLRAFAGNVSGALADRPTIMLTCVDDPRRLLELRLPDLPSGGGRVEQEFSIPQSACDAQWLRIQASSALNGDAPSFWVDDVGIAAVR